jgi:hypothetical protein
MIATRTHTNFFMCSFSQAYIHTHIHTQHGGDPYPDELLDPQLQSRVVPAGFDSHNSQTDGLHPEMFDDEASIDERSSMRSGVSKSQVCVCVCVYVYVYE